MSRWNPIWDQTRAESGGDYVYEDNRVLIATDFECGSGANMRPEGDGYAIDVEPEPGDHAYSGMGYYYCFGIRSKQPAPTRATVQVHGNMMGKFGADQRHAVVRRRDGWSHLSAEAIRPDADAEVMEFEIPLPGAEDENPVLFVSNFHWHPYTELIPYLERIGDDPSARVSVLGKSVEGRDIYRVDIGNEETDAPHMVLAQTPQPSEMGTWTSRAVIDDLLSDDAAEIRKRHRFTIVPATNPDGTVRGLGVSHPLGRFPYFEGRLTAEEGPDVLPEMAAMWDLLKTVKPWLFIEWHSNNWHRRPGQMLLRFRPDLAEDGVTRAIWEDFDQRLMALPETYHGNWTGQGEGIYHDSLCFQAITRLGAIAHMIKHHDKFPIEQNCRHAVACVREAVLAWDAHHSVERERLFRHSE